MSSSLKAAHGALKTAVLWGAIGAGLVGVVGGFIGFAISGETGVWSAIVGSAVAFVFMGITAGSILLGYRLSGGNMASAGFFGTVMLAWLIKFALFLVVAVAIKDSGLFTVPVAFWSLIAAVMVALVSDIVAISRARVPVVDMIGS
jgi:hypothetical protein